jgi:hypothetical protein
METSFTNRLNIRDKHNKKKVKAKSFTGSVRGFTNELMGSG